MTAAVAPIVMPFGKHRGQPLADISRHYLAWVLENTDVRPPLREAIAAELERRKTAPPSYPHPTATPGTRAPESPPAPTIPIDANAIIDAGERALAARLAGDAEARRTLAALAARLRALAGAAGLAEDAEVPF